MHRLLEGLRGRRFRQKEIRPVQKMHPGLLRPLGKKQRYGTAGGQQPLMPIDKRQTNFTHLLSDRSNPKKQPPICTGGCFVLRKRPHNILQHPYYFFFFGKISTKTMIPADSSVPTTLPSKTLFFAINQDEYIVQNSDSSVSETSASFFGT